MKPSFNKGLFRQISQMKQSFNEDQEQKGQSPKSSVSALPIIAKDIKKKRNPSLLRSTECQNKHLKQPLFIEQSIQYPFDSTKSLYSDQSSTQESLKRFLTSSSQTKSNNQSPRDETQNDKLDVRQKYLKSSLESRSPSNQESIQQKLQKRIAIKVDQLEKRENNSKSYIQKFDMRKKVQNIIERREIPETLQNQSSQESSSEESFQNSQLAQRYIQDQTESTNLKNKIIEQLKLQLFYPSALEGDLNKIDQNVMFNNDKLKQMQKKQNETTFTIKKIKTNKRKTQI